MHKSKQTAVVVMSVSGVAVALAITLDSWLVGVPGVFGALVGTVLITSAFYEQPDYRPRRWGESVWQASGRQLGSGKSGCSVAFGIVFIICGLACLIAGQPTGMLICIGLSWACLKDYIKK